LASQSEVGEAWDDDAVLAGSLRTFAATRIVELVVHGDDLAVSIGTDGLPPGDAAFDVATQLMVATAAVQHDQLAVVRTLARRERAPGNVVPVF
jgi:hypothetical protein